MQDIKKPSDLFSASLIMTEQSKISLPWKVLIVDDDEQIHLLSKLVLSNYEFQGRALHLDYAYSKDQAISIIKKDHDFALILLDVVMESDLAGLECVQIIRDDLKLTDVRIVLRTGQPGSIAENELMLKYDINDYKSKTELTKDRLFSTITASLRTYQHIKQLHEYSERLNNFNEQLEHRVKQRTEELELANEKIKRQQQVLVQSEKLASVSHLSAGIAHEINNPLGALCSNFEFINDHLMKYEKFWNMYKHLKFSDPSIDELLTELDLDWVSEESSELITDAKDSMERIARIVKDLRVFSALSHKIESNVELLDLITNSSAHLFDDENANLFISSNFSELILTCAPDALKQAFHCLVTNAIEAQDKDIINVDIDFKRSEQYIEILFKDNGCGIEAENIHKIFDPFYTTKEVGKGTGLGLTIALTIIKGHQGDIEVKSEIQNGTIFTVKLPI